MKIVICSSISAFEEVLKIRSDLEELGHSVEIPKGITDEYLKGRTDVDMYEKSDDKIKNDVFKRYFETIKQSEAVLVVNPELKGIESYIGVNTLIEMVFAYILDKKIFILNDMPAMNYAPEILATKPIVLKGKIEFIR